ncbi:endonuclease/exonuclease/phosphatase family protein [Alkalibacterium thalassium]|uniref:Maltose 6'-phosphate phosphatase n=1 Tax=Alkalibacterium thalassium TaxID=426701 RepID=A0A1G8WI40_9LACT|nr:endonuclease/exonuclease/phosphatase family protein [Alkalibacterium thalassium]SDJ78008.1 maltose 6'-phosphate phosphatase [Alkalibacterium thalassium]
MKVLTLNTHAWMEDDPYEKLDALAEQLAESEYDVIALQEVNQTIDAKGIKDDTFIAPEEKVCAVPIKEDNFARLLVKKLKRLDLTYYWSWAANHVGYDLYDEGVAILSKVPFKAESQLVSESEDYTSHYTRKVLKASFDHQDRQWVVLSAHYSWWTDGNGRQLFEHEWMQTLDMIRPDERETAIVMGDFNNDSSVQNEGYALVRRSAPFLNDAFETADVKIGEATVEKEIDGWEGHSDLKRIDYIFAGKGFDIEQYQVTFDGKNGPVVSDHFGVEALVKLKLT